MKCQRRLVGLSLQRGETPLGSINEGFVMTESAEVNINEALALIDEGLALTMARELMSTSEVADLLLDVRTILAAVPAAAVDEVLDEPIPAAVQ